MENWKPIEGYENLYEVSDFGRVRRLEGKVKSGLKNSGYQTNRGRTLKQNLKRNGYLTVDLSKGNEVRTSSVHRLVAKTFIPNPQNLPCVNHINANKRDNRAENLEWCTAKQNSEHAQRTGLYDGPGKKAILCVETGMRFISSYQAGEWLNETRFGNSRNVRSLSCKIRSATNGIQPKAYGYHWKKIDM